MQNEILKKIEDAKVIAILRGYFYDDALKIAEALSEGGITAIEFTFDGAHPETFSDTQKTISMAKAALAGSVLIGAGTVVTPELVNKAYESGAEFIVSPDFNPAVVKETKRLGLVSMPGAFTPSEIKQAYDLGADFVKVFPATTLGPEYFHAVLQPLSYIKLFAFGGVSADNAADFMRAGCKGVGIGGCLFKKEWVKEGAFEKIKEAAEVLLQRLS